MIRAALVTLCASAAVVAGCGDDDSSPSASEENAMKAKEERAMKAKEERAMKAKESKAMKGEAAVASAKGAQVRVVRSRFGAILADKRGQAYYLFGKEKSKRSECYGGCARAWPPVITKGRPQAGRDARRGLLGTTRRRGGKLQLTYAGHPLYYYEEDSPGRVLCHNVNEFGGLWLVVRANGQPVS